MIGKENIPRNHPAVSSRGQRTGERPNVLGQLGPKFLERLDGWMVELKLNI